MDVCPRWPDPRPLPQLTPTRRVRSRHQRQHPAPPATLQTSLICLQCSTGCFLCPMLNRFFKGTTFSQFFIVTNIKAPPNSVLILKLQIRSFFLKLLNPRYDNLSFNPGYASSFVVRNTKQNWNMLIWLLKTQTHAITLHEKLLNHKFLTI